MTRARLLVAAVAALGLEPHAGERGAADAVEVEFDLAQRGHLLERGAAGGAGEAERGDGRATLQQVAALRKVEFDLDRVSGATLAGVRLEGKSGYRDLAATDVARLAAAVAAREVPLSMTVHVEGTNPETNSVSARLVRMDWTLLVDDEETVSGRFDREIVFAPGQPTDVPIDVELDLWDFFSGRAEDLFALAQAATGTGPSRTMTLAVEATPTIETPIGPIRYPAPIRIVQRDVDVP